MKYNKPIKEIRGPVLKRDLLGETREKDKFHAKEELMKYLKSEIKRQGENVVIKNLDVSLIDDLSELFYDCESIRTLDLFGWKTSNIKNMNRIFSGCFKLESLDVSGWDTSNVDNISHMFWWCENLESLDLSGWDTSKVTDMYRLFSNCKNLTSLDLSGWDTSSIIYIDSMFENCPAPYEVVDNKIIKK